MRVCCRGNQKRGRDAHKHHHHHGGQQQQPLLPAQAHNKCPRSSSLDANKDVKMLAKATKALQEHVKDMTEKTKSTCCVGKPASMKENILIHNQINSTDPVHYIVDRTNGNTYVRGKLLGKVRVTLPHLISILFCCISFLTCSWYNHDNPEHTFEQ